MDDSSTCTSFKTNFVELYTQRVNNNKAGIEICKKAMQYYFHFDGFRLYRRVHFFLFISRYTRRKCTVTFYVLTVKKGRIYVESILSSNMVSARIILP